MPVDIINAPALHAAVEGVLEALPDVLRPHATALRASLRRLAYGHRTVRPARRRQADPVWAQAKFDAGRPLHRFAEREAENLADDLGELVRLLIDVAHIDGLGAAAAVAFLRSLPHRREPLDDVVEAAETVLARSRTLRLLAGRHDLVRAPAGIVMDGLDATRRRSLDAVIRLGREARNCLADTESYWHRFAEGALNFWALRAAGALVAVLAMTEGRLEEVFGPDNVVLAPEHAHAVARLCARSGWTIAKGCDGLLPVYAGPIRLGPLRFVLGERVVVYAEWADAVRIDMSHGADNDDQDDAALLMELLGAGPRPRILALAFDPARPCADAILYGPDPRRAVDAVGRDRLRRIVANVALGHAAPNRRAAQAAGAFGVNERSGRTDCLKINGSRFRQGSTRAAFKPRCAPRLPVQDCRKERQSRHRLPRTAPSAV